MIEVEQLSADKLSRTVWRFNVIYGGLILCYYAESEKRETTRHKFKANEFWSRTDERRHFSRLERPTEIPEWVILQAARKMKINVFIGFSNNECLQGVVGGGKFTPEPRD